jgi:nucleotide-binding universal stress UspA family protein
MRRILVAVDGSDNALRALDFAVQQARLTPKAELHVLTVRPSPSTYTAWEIYVSADRIREVSAERAKAILQSAAERLAGSDCRFELEQLEGEPAETITRRAEELNCDSIVSGTHGLGMLGILLMGSVAQRVVHHARRPVTLVK